MSCGSAGPAAALPLVDSSSRRALPVPCCPAPPRPRSFPVLPPRAFLAENSMRCFRRPRSCGGGTGSVIATSMEEAAQEDSVPLPCLLAREALQGRLPQAPAPSRSSTLLSHRPPICSRRLLRSPLHGPPPLLMPLRPVCSPGPLACFLCCLFLPSLPAQPSPILPGLAGVEGASCVHGPPSQGWSLQSAISSLFGGWLPGQERPQPWTVGLYPQGPMFGGRLR